MIIIIPYNHESFSLNCDFIFQTIKQLLKKNHSVYLILRLHPATILKRYNYCSAEIQTQIEKQLSGISTERLIIIQSPIIFPKILERLSSKIIYLNEKFFLQWFKIFTASLSSAIIWSFDPQNEDIFSLNYSPKTLKLFDCVDYFTSVDQTEARLLQKQVINQIKKSDIAIANSEVLLQKYKKFNKNIYKVPQGFDIQSFQKKRSDSASLIRKNHLPKIGFIGNLTYRLDFELLFKLIKKTPQYTYYLSNSYLECQPEDSILHTKRKINKLRSLTNIVWIPQISRQIVKEYLEIFDICIVPYDIKQTFNKYCYPMKVFEYFYLGKPVISTPIEELKRFPKYVKIGSTVEEWGTHIKDLLAKPWPERYKQQQRKLAINNSWERKISEILKHIESYENVH